VSLHHANARAARAAFESSRAELEESLKRARKKPAELEALRAHAVACAGYLTAIDPDSPEIWGALRIGSQAAAAIFALAAKRSGTVDVMLGAGPPVALPSTGPTPAAHARAWREGFLLACLSRNPGALDVLSHTPQSLLKRKGGSEEVHVRYPVLMQGLWLRADDVPQRIVALLDATKPGKLHGAAEEFALCVLVPEVELLYRFLLEDRAAFAESLTWALERHRAYYSAAPRAADPAGFLALGPAVMCAIAHDSGWPVRVASPYVPPHLVAGPGSATD
jgi:hypothetical protein